MGSGAARSRRTLGNKSQSAILRFADDDLQLVERRLASYWRDPGGFISIEMIMSNELNQMVSAKPERAEKGSNIPKEPPHKKPKTWEGSNIPKTPPLDKPKKK
jgi:hypothetical protein